MEPTRSTEKIASDLERYSIMAEHYKKHPERKEPNGIHLASIAFDLMNLSEMELPQELQTKCSELFTFFHNSYNF